MSTVKPVWIDAQGGELFAMVHEPDPDVDNGTVIVMPSAGQDNRVGPQRIYLKTARALVAQGYKVVRLDLTGIGDSRTKNPKISLDSHKPEDVDAGVRWAQKTWGVKTVYLVALCAGARVTMRYASKNRNIAGITAWSLPTLSEGDTPYLNSMGVKRAVFSRRLLTAEWWKNRLEYGPKEVRQLAGGVVDRLTDAMGIKLESPFIKAVDKYLKEGRPAMFVFGSLDKVLCDEFQERFSSVPRGSVERQCFEILPEGVHTLATIDSHEAVIDMLLKWLSCRLEEGARSSESSSIGVLREAASAS